MVAWGVCVLEGSLLFSCATLQAAKDAVSAADDAEEDGDASPKQSLPVPDDGENYPRMLACSNCTLTFFP